MSKTVDPDPERDGAEKDEAWLERNARALDFHEFRDTESWERAQEGDGVAEYEQTGPTTFWVQLPGGEKHDVLLVRSEDQDGSSPDIYAGACDCSGFEYHGYCAHLILLGRTDIVDDVVATVPSKFDEIVDESVQEETETVETETVDAEIVDDVETTSKEPVEPQGSSPENPPATPSETAKTPATPSDPFAQELAEDVPDKFVMRLRGDVYIRRAGYARIAQAAGYRLSLEEVVGAHETDWKHAKYRAYVYDPDGEEVVHGEVGSAHVDLEDLEGAAGELDELAATRAARRAIEWATGAGATIEQ